VKCAEECAAKAAESKVEQPAQEEEDPVESSVLVADASLAAPASSKKSLEQQVAEWSKATETAVTAAIEAVAGVTIAGHAEGAPKGRKAVEAARLALKKVRTPIEKRRKELKAPILALGELVDNEARRLTALIQPREEALENEALAYDADQARIKREAEVAEKARIQARVDAWIAAEGATESIPGLAQLDEEIFLDLLSAAQGTKAARDAEREAQRLADEARLAEERAERVRQEQEVRDRIAAEQKKLDEEREALARERSDLEAARKVLKEQQDKLEADARAEQDRKDAQAKAEADAKAEVDRLAKEDQERREAIAKREALRPDREKIAAFANAWIRARPKVPEINDPELSAYLLNLTDDIENRFTITIHEMQENA
jgi:DNA repair exonuclease SbcCD ATPase subunit